MAVYLLVTGLLFLVFGLLALFRPVQTIAFPYSLHAESVDAKNYLRSGAGGVTVACAGVFIAASFSQSRTAPRRCQTRPGDVTVSSSPWGVTTRAASLRGNDRIEDALKWAERP
jgi:hypothetical protein